ncbi:MAG TPA: GtrA family protein [Puia sp.]|jgi:putative flippase GtrA|nr:GtrA family protein [Puia sp.]
MITFTKAQLISLLATAVDFGITWLLITLLGVPKLAGGATGTLCGGVTHFMISRTWVFNAREKKWAGQLNRYVLVWIGNFVLNVSGLWLLHNCMGINVWIAKIITAVLVAVLYNYQLQKRFVFKP